MKIALVGATGFVGSAVLVELLQRAHQVTAVMRDPSKLAPQSGLTVVAADAFDAASIANAVRDHDAVISAFNPGWNEPGLYEKFLRGSSAIERGTEESGVKRLLVVGGAGSLYVAPGMQLVDTPDFVNHVPENIIPGAKAARDALAGMRDNTVLEWTFVSPPAFLEAGERIGSYRVGGENLLMEGDKPAGISVADLALAIVDEIERPQHVRARFTVASPQGTRHGGL